MRLASVGDKEHRHQTRHPLVKALTVYPNSPGALVNQCREKHKRGKGNGNEGEDVFVNAPYVQVNEHERRRRTPYFEYLRCSRDNAPDKSHRLEEREQ